MIKKLKKTSRAAWLAFIRLNIFPLLIFFCFEETGPWTALVLSLLYIFYEFDKWHERRVLTKWAADLPNVKENVLRFRQEASELAAMGRALKK